MRTGLYLSFTIETLYIVHSQFAAKSKPDSFLPSLFFFYFRSNNEITSDSLAFCSFYYVHKWFQNYFKCFFFPIQYSVFYDLYEFTAAFGGFELFSLSLIYLFIFFSALWKFTMNLLYFSALFLVSSPCLFIL